MPLMKQKFFEEKIVKDKIVYINEYQNIAEGLIDSRMKVIFSYFCGNQKKAYAFFP
jgi:hypothetical protein